ncbi:hypothetical protein [Photobacterium rosenbergii]|uniref:hypothetical protein n=1 Tax=Photobacterium rosenbergii TaxID=294936 RepID=UPI001C999AAC|nr:hypothetical protein [Photobacterium rosenbergii]MBY5948379.1 hypothetical protein [Photobacterium rosenbergii]
MDIKYLAYISVFFIFGCNSDSNNDNWSKTYDSTDGDVHTQVWTYVGESRSGLLNNDTAISKNNVDNIFSSESPKEKIISLNIDDEATQTTWSLTTANENQQTTSTQIRSRESIDGDRKDDYNFTVQASSNNLFYIILSHDSNLYSYFASGVCSFEDYSVLGVCTYTDSMDSLINADFEVSVYKDWLALPFKDQTEKDISLPISQSIGLDYDSTLYELSLPPTMGRWVIYACPDKLCKKWNGTPRQILANQEQISVDNTNYYIEKSNQQDDLPVTEAYLGGTKLDEYSDGWSLMTITYDNADQVPFMQSRTLMKDNYFDWLPGKLYEYQIFPSKTHFINEISYYDSKKDKNDLYLDCNPEPTWDLTQCKDIFGNLYTSTSLDFTFYSDWLELSSEEQNQTDLVLQVSQILGLTADDLPLDQ